MISATFVIAALAAVSQAAPMVFPAGSDLHPNPQMQQMGQGLPNGAKPKILRRIVTNAPGTDMHISTNMPNKLPNGTPLRMLRRADEMNVYHNQHFPNHGPDEHLPAQPPVARADEMMVEHRPPFDHQEHPDHGPIRARIVEGPVIKDPIRPPTDTPSHFHPDAQGPQGKPPGRGSTNDTPNQPIQARIVEGPIIKDPLQPQTLPAHTPTPQHGGEGQLAHPTAKGPLPQGQNGANSPPIRARGDLPPVGDQHHAQKHGQKGQEQPKQDGPLGQNPSMGPPVNELAQGQVTANVRRVVEHPTDALQHLPQHMGPGPELSHLPQGKVTANVRRDVMHPAHSPEHTPESHNFGPKVSQLPPGQMTANVRRMLEHPAHGSEQHEPQTHNFGPKVSQLPPGQMTANVRELEELD